MDPSRLRIVRISNIDVILPFQALQMALHLPVDRSSFNPHDGRHVPIAVASRAGASKTVSKTIRVAGLESRHATLTSVAMTHPHWRGVALGLIDTSVPISATLPDSS
jgi:hypothetical protein